MNRTKTVAILKEYALLIATIVGVLVGLGLGFILRPLELSTTAEQLVAYPGEMFTRALQMMILPLVISSLLVGSAGLNAKLNGKIAVRTISYFLITSLCSAILGVIVAVVIHPGHTDIKDELSQDGPVEERKNTLLDNFLDLGRNIVPSNIFSALFMQTQTEVVAKNVSGNVTIVREVVLKDGTNTLGIIFFALLFGTVLGTMGERSKGLIESIKLVDDVIMAIVRGVMWVTPIGVASIIAGKIVGVADLAAITAQLGMFVLSVLVSVLIFQLIVYQLIYLIVKRSNPFKFYFTMFPATTTAFATASAAVTLPTTFRCIEKFNIDKRIAQFVLPIGATVNMDGTATFVSIASIFIAQMNGLPLGIGDYVTVAISATAVSVASASVPSAALALMFIVLNAINVPTTDIGLLFAVDWLADRIRTTNNLLGDCYATVVVEHFSKKELELLDGQEDLESAVTQNEILTQLDDSESGKVPDPLQIPSNNSGSYEQV